MGCFDTVLVPCPKCKTIAEAQSKSGNCGLHIYKLEDAPTDVLSDVNRHAPFNCSNCGTNFEVKLGYRCSVEISNNVIKNGYQKHECVENVSGRIIDSFDRKWNLDINGCEYSIEIEFCPYCGVKL